MTVSSAYICRLVLGHTDGKWLNSIGPRMEPCGTPVDKSRVVDWWFWILTCCCLIPKYDCIQLSVSEEKLKADHFETRNLWFTVSNAFLRSRKTAATTPPLSIRLLIFSVKKTFFFFFAVSKTKLHWMEWKRGYVQEIRNLLCNQFFCNFRDVLQYAYRRVIIYTEGSPFLKVGITAADFQTLGHVPCVNDNVG